MPVFNFDFNRSVSRLNLSAEQSGIFTPNLTSLEMHDSHLQRFNAIVARFAPNQPGFTLDQIAGSARRVLRAAAKGQESAFIKVRMRRAGEIRAAFQDPKWTMPAELVGDVAALLEYLDDSDSLIPASVPIVGMLDEAILVDVAMERLRPELDDYAKFCRYRVAEAARLDMAPSAVDIDRERWEIEYAQEQRLEQQLRRVRNTRYAGNNSVRCFRVS
ncbi:MAG TPA: hypothetical protein VFN13_07135 [Rudaea sp.]|nr:hypothetical protein [Rudaea sp.]